MYRFRRNKHVVPTTPRKAFDHAFIVTAFKNWSNLDNVANSILKNNHTRFTIYIVADNCHDYHDEFKDNRVIILKPHDVFANQIKSHFYAIENFVRPHDYLTIIDSDNLVSPEFIQEIEVFLTLGYHAVQGQRKAKNLDTPMACIDALNELYYVFYDRKILFGIDSSSMLSGSGMCFSVDLYKECMHDITNTGAGFDKILQKKIIEKNYKIAFAEKAVVFDEKTSSADQLVKQRARWNNTWFRYFKFGLSLMFDGIKQLNWNKGIFGFILTRPPLFLLLILSFMVFLANLWIDPRASLAWVIVFAIFITGFFLALTKSETDPRIYRSIIHIPRFIFLQIVALFKARKANQISVATEHPVNQEIADLKTE